MAEINTNLDTTPLPPNDLVAQDPQSAELAGYVRTKTFGREVREAIARSIELNSTRSKSAESLASETVNVANDLTDRFNQQIGALTEDSEVIDARGGKATLGQRLDETTAQLAQNVQQINEIVINASSIGITNNSTALEIETALNTNVLNKGVKINFNGVYTIDKPIILNKEIKFTGNNATFIFSPNFTYENGNTLKMFEINVDGVEFNDISFKTPVGLTKGSMNNCYILNNKGKSRIVNCKFYDLPKAGSNFNGAIGFMITGVGFNIVDSCYFENCPGSVFTKQPHDIIVNCIAFNPHDVSFVLNGNTCYNSTINGCTVYNPANSVSMHIGVEQGVSDFIITDNNIFGIKDGIGIGCISVGGVTLVGDGGIIANNLINGNNIVSDNPMTGIAIGRYYKNIKIHDNIIKNIGGGHKNNSCVMIDTGENTGIEFYNNKIFNTNTWYPLYVKGLGLSGKLKIQGNTIDGGGQLRCIQIVVTEIPGLELIIKENELKNSAEGINGATVTVLKELLLKNNEFINVTNPINVPNIYGTFTQNNFNVFGKSFDHQLSLKKQKHFYSNSANMTPTNGSWQVGDQIHTVNPGAGAYATKLCIASGSPGVWKGIDLVEG